METAEKIQPALTPDQWATKDAEWVARLAGPPHPALTVWGEHDEYAMSSVIVRPLAELHAVAALALYGQPFGFTPEDVAVLKDAIAELTSNDDGRAWGESSVAPLRTLLAKIVALLPLS